MDVYATALLLHIIGALGLFIAIGLEWLALDRLGRTATRDRAEDWLDVMSIVRRIGPGSLVLLLIPGLYMAATRWGFDRWTGGALIGFAGLLLLGGLFTGPATIAFGRALKSETGELSLAFQARVRETLVRRALWARTGLALGIVGLMVFKPDFVPSVAILLLLTLVGFALSLLAVPGRPATAPAA
jgi:hypothetical protein